MAWASIHIISIIILALYILDQLCTVAALGVSGDHSTLFLRRSVRHGSRPAMLLPLYLSAPNNSRSSPNIHRRQLRRSDLQRPNARMGLYDDLLHHGYYTTRIWIGTPPQRFSLIVDTGSTVTYVPCSTCEHCGIHQDPKFEPDLSSTYQPLKCNIACTCDSERRQCVYERQYAELSTSSGVLGEDVISFGNQSELAPQHAVFGCENVETGDLYSQHADGIMGLGSGDLSIVDQLVDKGIISDSFSLCYGGMDFVGGAMVLGGILPPEGMVFAQSDPVRSPYYNIDLKEIHVAGKRLPLNSRVFDGKHGTVLDSGTTYAYFPEAAFLAFRDAIVKALHSFKQVPGPDPNYHDLCFSGAGNNASQLSKNFPVVDMVFGNGQKLSLSPENYMFRHSKVHGGYCLGVFQNGKDPTTLLGGIMVRNTLVMYDREHSKIGFWKTNCSELWERLHMSDVPQSVPSSSDERNQTEATVPSPSPSGAQNNMFPEELQIAQITVLISFNNSYMDLKPHITELTEFIAHGLDVSTLQVHLLNFTSLGNVSLLRWAITPLGSSDYISSATATTIVSRLAENHLQLPDTFRNYKLVGWNIEPSPKRSWWQQNYLWVVPAVLVALLIVFSIPGIYLIWKRRQPAVNPYKPVNAAVPEQELQPL